MAYFVTNSVISLMHIKWILASPRLHLWLIYSDLKFMKPQLMITCKNWLSTIIAYPYEYRAYSDACRYSLTLIEAIQYVLE